MPRVSDGGRGGRLHVPGVYEKLLPYRCRCGFPCRSDPRLRLYRELGWSEWTAEQWAQLEWFEAQCAWEAEQDRAKRLAAGEPYVTDRRRFGGRNIPREDGWPAWLRDAYSDVESVRVFPDDTIEPAED